MILLVVVIVIQFALINARPHDIQSVKTAIEEKLITKQLRFTERSTNIEYIFQNTHNNYSLYELRLKNGTNANQLQRINALIERYLQKSFETPDKSYPYVFEICGSTVFGFFSRNTSVSLENINALLLSHLQAYDNSDYICFLSVLEQHRQQGLATQLLNKFINRAISSRRSQITLHVNTKNTNALSLYLKCGMRCIQFIENHYFGDQTYPTQDAFALALKLTSVKNSTTVCQSSAAISTSLQDELLHKQICEI